MGRDNYGMETVPCNCSGQGLIIQAGSNVEMEPLAPNGSSFARQGDPNAILNECQAISDGIAVIKEDLDALRRLQKRSLSDTDSSANSETNRNLDAMNSKIMSSYRGLAARIKDIKRQPDSGSPKNAPQVTRVDNSLKGAINEFQKIESQFQRDLKEQMARQYRVVRPNASEAEVQEAVEDTSNQQVFSQALMQSDRSGQARQAKMAVQDRHVAIQKIEKQMVELAQLFQDMEALVEQQEAAVTVIEQKGEEVVENMESGNQQIMKSIDITRSRNRKKWWCLLIVGMCRSIQYLFDFSNNSQSSSS
jgi:syntaxin 1B/2/3